MLEKFTDDLLFPGIEGLRNEKHFFIKNKNCLFRKMFFYYYRVPEKTKQFPRALGDGSNL